VASLKAETGAALTIALPEDDELRGLSESGKPLQGLPRSNRVVAGIDRLLFEGEVPVMRRET
jgi:hypothetical protein